MKYSKFVPALILFGICITSLGHASADTFNQNKIIDDSVFNNSSSMTAGQIDTFLNSFPNSCISPNSGFRAIDPIGYNPTQGYLYGSYVTAGQVISDSAQTYGINPQVLLTTLQKEQSLVVGAAGYCNDGSQHKYAAAVGYGCPDSSTTYDYSNVNLYQRNGITISSTGTTCVNSAAKAGFSQQVIRAAWLFKFGQQRSLGNVAWAVIKGNWNNSDDPQSCYGGSMTQGTFQRCPSGATTYYDGYTTIDNTPVHIDSGATAALYWYTPHFHGNQNFFSIYTGWFGPTLTSAYSWEYAGQSIYQDSSMTAPVNTNSIVAGTRYYLTLSAKNVGSSTWNKNSINLATSQPLNRASKLYDASWFTASRAATLNESSVAPGQTGTFGFWITAPSTPGTYKEYFNLVAENFAWMNDIGLNWQINVQPRVYAWQYQGQQVYTDASKSTPVDPTNIVAGNRYYLTLSALNVGTLLWTNSGPNPIELGTEHARDRSSSVQDRSWLKSNRAALLSESSVGYGQTGTFGFWITAPSTPGTYKEYFNLVAENFAWMNDIGLNWQINVQPRVYAWQYQGQQAYTDATKTAPVNLSAALAGSRYYLTLNARNTGNVPWTNSGPNPIELGTDVSQDRTSLVRDPSWLKNNRVTLLDEGIVAPGQTGTFGFWITAPSTPGTYKEYFNLVAEYASWMNEIGLNWQITVQ